MIGEPGATIGGYQVIAVIARDATGELVTARGSEGVPAILRIYPAERCTDAAAVQRCLDDARAAAAVGHPGIAGAIGAGVHGDCAYVAFSDPGDGGDGGDGKVETFDGHARAAGRLSAALVAVLARQVADALAAAHARGLVHRDLRPSRLIVATDEHGQPTARVLDFGSARLEPVPTTTDAASYAAPERWTSPQQVDPRADIYSLGCIAFELACGRPPFQGSLDELRARHLSEPPPPARGVMPDLPPGLEHLLGKMMAKQPGDRPGAIGEVARAFEVLGGGTLAASASATTEALPALPPVLHGTAAGEPPPASPPELYTRVGEIGEVAQLKSPPPSPAATVAVSGSLAGIAVPAGANDAGREPRPGETLTTRAIRGPSSLMILLVGAVIAAAVVAAILVFGHR